MLGLGLPLLGLAVIQAGLAVVPTGLWRRACRCSDQALPPGLPGKYVSYRVSGTSTSVSI